LHMAQLMPLPLTVSCLSKIQIGFTILVPAHPGSPGQRAVKRVCVCSLLNQSIRSALCVCRSMSFTEMTRPLAAAAAADDDDERQHLETADQTVTSTAGTGSPVRQTDRQWVTLSVESLRPKVVV